MRGCVSESGYVNIYNNDHTHTGMIGIRRAGATIATVAAHAGFTERRPEDS